MTLTYYGYSKCSTCRKAKKWLEQAGLSFTEVDITEQPPAPDELRKIIERSELPVQKFFNVSGRKYRELQLKDKLPSMSDEEKIELLSSDGMLIKRPIVADKSCATVGFNEEHFQTVWSK